jgi:hypothetical protein
MLHKILQIQCPSIFHIQSHYIEDFSGFSDFLLPARAIICARPYV